MKRRCLPVRPKIADGPDVSSNAGPDQLRTIEVEEVESEGAATERAEEENDDDDVIRNPMKWWNEKDDDGLGQDALWPDPAEKRTKRTPAAAKTGGEGDGGEEDGGRRAKKNTVVHRPTREEMEQHLSTHCSKKV